MIEQLITAVIVKAVQDARDPDPVKRLDAVTWLAGEGPLWLEACGVDLEGGISLQGIWGLAGKLARYEEKRTKKITAGDC